MSDEPEVWYANFFFWRILPGDLDRSMMSFSHLSMDTFCRGFAWLYFHPIFACWLPKCFTFVSTPMILLLSSACTYTCMLRLCLWRE